MLVRSPNRSYEVIDFRKFAPGASTELMYVNVTNGSVIGGLAVGVPGELRGFELLHSRHGKLPWKKVFEPAISLAKNGYDISRPIALTSG